MAAPEHIKVFDWNVSNTYLGRDKMIKTICDHNDWDDYGKLEYIDKVINPLLRQIGEEEIDTSRLRARLDSAS